MYLFLGNDGEVLYVGKAKQLRNRVASYFTGVQLAPKTAALVEKVKKIRIIIVESELESLLLEASLIKKYQPKYNVKLTDGKAYPLIRITAKASFPAVVTARRPDDPESIYFGPYPNSKAMYAVLKMIRRAFPYQSTVNHPNKPCLYHHLGLCPCVTAFPTQQNREAYKRTLRHINNFLDGDTKKVIKDLQKERDFASKQEEFEKAQKLQKQIDYILLITNPVSKPFEYETNPNLRSDRREEELADLQSVLRQNGIKTEFPRRIECYDNSNLQGTNPTSSLVVLTDGEIDKSQYRRFKIKTVKGPNDFASMQEVLTRRLTHKEWPLPQLIIVDGGKGQISSAMEVLRAFGLSEKITLVGLAKREETIITSDFQEILLPRSSKALRLVMKIRDEAHRFAITFHRKLRSKAIFE